MRYIALVILTAGLASCATVGGPGVSSYFDCGNGSMLKVTYGRNTALVQKDRDPIIRLRSVPSTGGSTYENKAGYRLSVQGDWATFSGRTREAPARCHRVAVPR